MKIFFISNFFLFLSLCIQAQTPEASKKLLDEVSKTISGFENLTFDFTYVLENPSKWCRNCFKNEKDDGIKALRCSRCKKVYYCSRECQKEDYKRHKRYEIQFANINV